MITIVDNMHKDFSDLIKSLEEKGDISFRNVADDNFRKSLLCAASFFEKTLCENVSNFIEIKSGNNRAIVEFVNNKAKNRQYHTWFSWKEKNANSFFGLFGEDFKTFIQEKIKSDPGMERSIKAFMDLGQERNRLVHQDYGTFYME